MKDRLSADPEHSLSCTPAPQTQSGSGFILSRHLRESCGSTYLELWLASDSGTVKLVSPTQRHIFFICEKNAEAAHSLLSATRLVFEYKTLGLNTFDHEPVGAVYLENKAAFYKARELLKRHHISCFEDDIQLVDRYLMERFVTGSTEFSGFGLQSKNTLQESIQSFSIYQLKTSKYKPRFKVLSLDIECSEQGCLYSIGLVAADYRCVLMIGEMQSSSPDWLQWVEDERRLLSRLVEEVQNYDPDIFIGWSVVNFDFKLLIRRAEHHHIKLTLGRDDTPIRWREPRNDSHQGYVSIAGRVIVDGIDALKTATYQFDSFSLEAVSQQLLGKGKLSDDVANRMEAINHDFIHNKLKLAEYNLQDCILVLEIFEHTRMLDFLVMRSQLTGLPLDRVGGSVAAFINVYLPKLHRAGYIAPKRPKDGGLASPGGYVMSSLPGLYKNVLVLDFKSLYPAIIRTFKIDPLGLVEGLRSQADAIPGYKGAVFSREKHFLPDIVESMWVQRDQAKKEKDIARSQAIKILMNSFYGVLGSGGCPFYDTRLASSITMRGHEIMQTTAKWIREMGYSVIYGDTDSTFVWLGDAATTAEARDIGKTLEKNINQKWSTTIREKYDLHNHLEIEFETHFLKFLMPTIRGSDRGSKKRYAGLVESEGENQLVFKGLEMVRSDWTPVAKQFQYTLYSMVFQNEDVRHYVTSIIKEIRAGRHDDRLVYRKRLRRKLIDYVKNVPPHVRAARLADRVSEKNGSAQKYRNKGWVSYLITVNGPEPLECLSSPIDYDHYIEKQIRPVADGILPFIGLSFESLAGIQLGLF